MFRRGQGGERERGEEDEGRAVRDGGGGGQRRHAHLHLRQDEQRQGHVGADLGVVLVDHVLHLRHRVLALLLQSTRVSGPRGRRNLRQSSVSYSLR